MIVISRLDDMERKCLLNVAQSPFSLDLIVPIVAGLLTNYLKLPLTFNASTKLLMVTV